MNALFATITEIAKDTFCLNLLYCEDGDRMVVKVYNDSKFELMIKMDSALENAQADGYAIDWRAIEYL